MWTICQENLLQKVQRNLHQSGKSSFKQMFFERFSKNWEREYQNFFDCQSHMSTAGFCMIIQYCLLQKVESGHPTYFMIEIIMQKRKTNQNNSNLKGYIKKSRRMHIKKSLFHYKFFYNLKNSKAMKRNSRCKWRPIPSENLCQISWKRKQKY